LNNSAKNETILLIFLVYKIREEISHQKIINSPTSPE